MKYVPRSQVEEWQAKDPIDRQETRLREAGVDTDAVHDEVKRAIEAGVQEALQMPMPDPATATEGLFADEAEELGDGQAPYSWWAAR
jgi:pyruvate dehydrogenase E1 component alpha subunit